jgi:hypothetical protein
MNGNRTLLGIAGLWLAAATPASAAPPHTIINQTEKALVEQMMYKDSPQVARAINAMLKNNLIRYKADESQVYMFVPNVPLKFLGFPIVHISGFDYDPFDGVPPSLMVGSAPPVFLEIDVAAPKTELRRRARKAGFNEGISPDRAGGEVWTPGLATYLAGKNRTLVSSITCSA